MPWRLGVLLAAIGTILFPVASLAQPTVPDVPKEIAVPPGHKLLFKVEGKGVQIYKAVAGKSVTPEWVLEAIPFNMGNRQKHGLFEKNRGRELRKTERDCKKPRKIGHSCMLRGLDLSTAPLSFSRDWE